MPYDHLVPITSPIAATDAASRFPSSSELEAVSKSLQKAQARLNAAEALTSNLDTLSEEATQAILTKFPEASETSKFLFSYLPETESHSLQEDLRVLIRVIAYCLIVGHDNPSESELLSEILSEVSRVLHNIPDISPRWYIEALFYFRNNHDLSEDSAVLVNFYIDYLMAAFY